MHPLVLKTGFAGFYQFAAPVFGVGGVFVRLTGSITYGKCCDGSKEKIYEKKTVELEGGAYKGVMAPHIFTTATPILENLSTCPNEESGSWDIGGRVRVLVGPLAASVTLSSSGRYSFGASIIWGRVINGGGFAIMGSIVGSWKETTLASA